MHRWGWALALVLIAGLGAYRTAGQLILIEPDSPIYALVIAAGDKAELDKDSVVTGDVHANKDVKVKKDARVDGDVSAVGKVDVKGTVNGTVVEAAAPRALPALPTEAEARALADRVFEEDTTLRDAVVDDVLFVDGKIRVEGRLEGTGTLIATKDIDLRDLDAAGAPPADGSRLSFIASAKIKVGKRRDIRGFFLAEHDVELEEGARVEGILLAHKNVKLKKGATLVYLPPDDEPPTVSGLAPADGSTVASAQPTIAASFADAGTGVDPASVTVTVDGVDRTGEAAVSAAGFTLTPSTPLAEGAHGVAVTVADRAGNGGGASWSFTVDTVAPSLAISAPTDGALVINQPPPIVTLTLADATSGVDPASLAVVLDGAPIACTVTAGAASCPLPPLANGVHEVAAEVADLAGNLAAASVGFEILNDTTAPSIVIAAPADGALVGTPLVAVRGTVGDDDRVAEVRVAGRVVAVDAGGVFSAAVERPEGPGTITVDAVDRAGNAATASVLAVVDTTAPELVVTRPAGGLVTHGLEIEVAGTARDANGLAEVTVGGVPATLDGDAFAVAVGLGDGLNAIAVRAVDAAGNVATRTVPVTVFALPAVTIEAPANLATVSTTTVEVRGRIAGGATQVTVAGVAATITGDRYVADAVPLHEGSNVLTAVAVGAGGRVATAAVTVARDTTPPRVVVQRPAAGEEVVTSPLAVRGEVIDLVAGRADVDPAVTVNGVPAVVDRGTFLAQAALAPGDNVLTVAATDALGNRSEVVVPVRFTPPSGPRLEAVAGDLQSGPIASPLPAPLEVLARDAAGDPVAGVPVVFKVTGNNGSLGPDGRRRVLATTGADGRAAVSFTLGTLAGAGTQTVAASAVGYAPASFTASATPGPPFPMIPDSGSGQVGVTGQALAEPFVAVVTDERFNRLPGVPVRFEVVAGGGTLSNGQGVSVVDSDRQGMVREVLTLGPEEGIANQVVRVQLAGDPAGPFTTFVASAKIAGDPAATRITGVVLDNTDRPVPGATVRVAGSGLETVSDADGVFVLTGVPVGALELEVDASTVTLPGVWPDLAFRMFAIAGRDNRLDRPVYLLPLDVASGLAVDATTGGVLTLAEIPGFALEVAPGSVTFADGGKSGVVSVTPVHSDRVPMVPNFGQQPRLIFTLQPAGARFDPPARLTLPNVDGLAPGESAELYSFDHDLMRFVTIGRATVSEDGTVLAANPGVGIPEGGWQCGGNPTAGAGAPHDCPTCETCNGSDCVADAGQNGDPCEVDKKCFLEDSTCENGMCKEIEVTVGAIQGPCVAGVGESVSYSVSSNDPDQIEWSSSGVPPTGMGASYSVAFPSEGNTSVTAQCPGGQSESKDVGVGKSCSSIMSELVENEQATPPPGQNFGGVQPLTIMPVIVSCAGNGEWCSALEKLTTVHGFGINGGRNINVSSASDPVVTPTTCAAIIADLTPPPPGTGEGPPRSTYWSQAITEAHERFHVPDFKVQVNQKTFNDLKAEVDSGSQCTGCLKVPRGPALRARAAALYNANYDAYANDPQTEIRAHNVSNLQYLTLVASIRVRAANAPPAENWPAACQ